ncbi:MAG TPA: cation-translocating P-type ATPase [Fimbriimonadaceae bacterium]|nr:cation-translocating P-type ATPase [Fimbriimonadaceae bacterium]
MKDPQVVLTALCGVCLVISFFVQTPVFAYLSVAFGAYFAIHAMVASLRERDVDVNLLMVLAAIGAIIVGRAVDAAALLFLFSLSSSLESLAFARTKSAIEGLIRLRPNTAVRLGTAGEEVVKVEQLQLGDRIKVPPFETVPVDGIVEAGESSLDVSAMTGESVPVAKRPGDTVLAGSRNLDTAFIMTVESTVGDSTLDKIVALVQDAQENKASGERISAWFGKRYTLFVIAAFLVSLGVRLALRHPSNEALYQSLTLLVALSPCALVISTPATTLSALAWSARNGILVRGGEFIEKAGRVDTLALDKTGTLTLGQPQLVEICVCGPDSCAADEHCWHGHGEFSDKAKEILRLATAAESYSAHPVAAALKSAARDIGLAIPRAEMEKTAPGLGVSAVIEGEPVVVGQLDFVRSSGVTVPQEFEQHLHRFHDSGMTVAVVSVGSQVAALGFQDAPRENAAEFLREATDAGIKEIHILSGDTQRTVNSIASKLGIVDFRGGLMPQDKARFIQELVAKDKQVMMVGDGVNDAPPLAIATVGVAMGGLGSDIALNAADVVLMHDDLQRIPQLMRLGKRTNQIIVANLFFAAGVIVCLTLYSFTGKLPLPLAVIGHEGSTVVVILNGLRVLRGP